MQPIKGYEGTVTINGIVTAFVNSWEANLETEEQTAGPFIGDNGKTYSFVSSRSLTGSLDATVPVGKDAGQTELIEAGITGDSVDMSLVTTAGYTITISSGIITGFSMTQDAGELITVSFDFKSSGTFTVL